MLLALSFVRQMPWGIEVFIISSQDCGKRIKVVKLCMAFESGPEWLEELFSAGYYLALILDMSNQRFLKIVCFRFPTNVPKKNEYIRF